MIVRQILATLRQIQHTPNRIALFARTLGLSNFHFHFKEVKAAHRDCRFDQKADAIDREISGEGEYTKDWSVGNFKIWLDTINQVELPCNCRILEIGSFEGKSTNFWLKTLIGSEIICVDTWVGSDEHQTLDMSAVEQRFNENTAWAGNRLQKFRMTSSQFLFNNASSDLFDLIYIDGSHDARDVIQDAIMGFERLKHGGLMIFDDFLWHGYANPIQNPTSAINYFIRLKKTELTVLRFGRQVHIKKN